MAHFSLPNGSILRISEPIYENGIKRCFIHYNAMSTEREELARLQFPSMPPEYNNCVEYHSASSQMSIRF